jgi:prepilin-type processing-associated H-X9-DG protein
VPYIERVHENTTYIPQLENNAVNGRLDAAGGHSYEIASYFNGTDAVNRVRKTQKSVVTYTYRMPQKAQYTAKGYNFAGQKANPSFVWIIVESDDIGQTVLDRPYDDYPDKGDNHGIQGNNVIFCDGHAEWVPRKKYIRSFFLGTDESKLLIPGEY